MSLYKKKPVIVEVEQWDGTVEKAAKIIRWIRQQNGQATFVAVGEDHNMRPLYKEPVSIAGGNELSDEYETSSDRDRYGSFFTRTRSDAPSFIVIRTLEGAHRADPQDFIIKGVAGEFYPCKPEIFAETYEPIEW